MALSPSQEGYRARVQYTDSAGARMVMKGPRRYDDERRARADLERIRAAGVGKPTRAEHLEAMAAEAHRLQAHAGFEVEVAIAVGKEQFDRKHMQTDSETEEETQVGGTHESHDDPFPDYDVSTSEACERLLTEPYPVQKSQQQPPPTNLLGASVKLARFRPIRSSVEDLRALLEARADPDVVIGVGDISPLRKVICFARTRNVRAMRELLFEYGAVESKEDKKRWELREYTDMNEKAWLRNFHRDDR